MKNKNFIYWGIISLISFIVMQITCNYHFYYIEQLQVFLWDFSYFIEKCSMIGGFSAWIGEFITQFFSIPFMGPLALTSILIGTGIGIQKYLSPKTFSPLFLFPVLSLFFLHLNFNCTLQSSISYLIVIWLLVAFKQIHHRISRITLGLLLVPFITWIGGSSFALFSACLLLQLLLEKKREWIFISLLALEVIVITSLHIYLGIAFDLKMIILPHSFYPIALDLPFYIYLPSLFLLLLILITPINKIKVFLFPKKILLHVFYLICIISYSYWGYVSNNDGKSSLVKKLDYFARTKQWQKLTESCHQPIRNYTVLNYLNMALMKQNKLTDDMFHYNQHGTKGLIINWNQKIFPSILLADIDLAIGNISDAQHMAFEANVNTKEEFNPRMLKILVQTNLIYGYHQVAERYLNMLSKTFHYNTWATNHRPFLYNDSLIQKDKILGPLQRCLPNDPKFDMLPTKYDTKLKRILKTNPTYKPAFDYLVAYYLLEKNTPLLKELFDKYKNHKWMNPLPHAIAESLFVLNEHYPNYAQSFSVDNQTIQQFLLFKKYIITYKNNPRLRELVQAKFGKTYWFYYIFNK